MGLAFQIVSGQSSYLCQFKTSWWHVHLSVKSFPVWGFLGGWQDILWAGISSLLLAPPEFFCLVVACHFCVPYQDLLWDNSCKWLLSCLERENDLSQWFPNSPMHAALWLGVHDTQEGSTNWNTGVWSRERFITGPKRMGGSCSKNLNSLMVSGEKFYTQNLGWGLQGVWLSSDWLVVS